MVYDASIFQNLGRGVTPIQSPMELYGQVQQLRQLAGQGRLQDMQIQQHEQAIADQGRKRSIFEAAGGDTDAAQKSLYSGGFVDDAHKLAKAKAEREKEKLETQKALSSLREDEFKHVRNSFSLTSNAASTALSAPTEQRKQVIASELLRLAPYYMPKEGDTPFIAEHKAGMLASFKGLLDSLADTPQDQLDQALQTYVDKGKTREEWAAEAKAETKGPLSDVGRIQSDVKKGLIDPVTGQRATAKALHISAPVGGMPKPPAGYRYTADGELEPIPGGPADRKIALENSKRDGVNALTQRTIETGERLLTHPGLSGAVGTWNLERRIPGTDAASFEAELDAFKAQNFLPAVQAMKGMGQLSDAEGKKLTDAIGALSHNMKEKDFKASLARIIADLKGGASKGQEKAPTKAAPPVASMPDPDMSTLGKNPRFPNAVWVKKGPSNEAGWYAKRSGNVERVE